jgi:DNA-binding response OmpR family regulator
MKKSIVLIHEDKREWDLFKNALGEIKGDFTCDYAPTAGEAMKLLHTQKVDFIFIDYLQSVQGFQLLAVIKANARLRQIKVFIYSENITEDVEKMARTLGASGCIEKPWTLSRLIHQFRAIFAGDLMPDYAFLPRV